MQFSLIGDSRIKNEI